MVLTERLRLIPSTPALAHAELENVTAFSAGIDATVPANWPPETLADALPLFLELMEANPSWLGWLGWYVVAVDEPQPTLIGSAGFTGPPDAEGFAEIGYSVLPQYHRRGFATEMVGGLLGWARSQGLRGVVAQTTPDNAGSRAVLAAHGFEAEGPGSEEGHTRYRVRFDSDAVRGSSGACVVGIDHVQVAAPPGGEDRARAFYGELLGLEELPKPPALAVRGGVWFRCGEQQIHIGIEKAFVPARKAHPALLVSGLEALAGTLAAAGFDVRPADDIPGVLRAFVADPFGNRVELIESGVEKSH